MNLRPPRALTSRVLAVGIALSLGFIIQRAAALTGDDQQPMLIEADTVEVDEAKGTSLYVGRVQVDQGTMRLLADQVTVHHRSDRRIKFIIARGNPASYKQQMDGDQGEVQAFAKRMDYDAERDELVLTDEALLIQGTDRITSDRIVYDRAKARMQAGGSGRVKITFTPDAKNGAPANGGTPPKPPATPPRAPASRP
ncbi:lipopolysaccharide transport periplasmic protein LptA [Lamprocystis purpurea]|uniref:lipopolysaccharide transport periplasmic protein LptA n=1 Tax=Lamprocystis purpurea TaxID=61598 RepID=UPI00035D575F|nr:lipopolysaccharide transport periplasmic protein LptA [Lamprocystis purpurea]